MNAQQHREKAAAHFAKEQESFDRCDTDGFVSQFCDNLNGRLHNVRASIAENGGRANFVGLYEGDRRVKARLIETKFGYSWLLHDSEEFLINLRGKVFLPTGGKSRVLKSLGLCERAETDLANACHAGSGCGLSGLSTVRIKTYRTGDKWGGDTQLIN